MKLMIAAALAASLFALPTPPASAATLSDTQKDCLFFPMLKKACWDLAADHVEDATSNVSTAAASVKVPVRWWNCTRAPEGSGYLYDC